MKASVIISDTLSQGMLLVDMLALCTQDFPRGQYEVILPDLGLLSTEEKALLAEFEKQYPNFRVIKYSGKGRSAMMNEAVRLSRGELLFFVESHCLVHRTWLREFVDVFKNKKVQAALGYIKTVPTSSWVGQAEELSRKKVMESFERLDVSDSYFDAHNVGITRKCFDAMGGLPENLPIMAEFALGAQLHKNGIKIVHFPQSKIWHFNDATFSYYSSVVASQGEDKTRMLKSHGKEFVQRYFPLSQKFMNHLTLFRLFRLPLLVMEKMLIYEGMAGFVCAKTLHMNKLAMRFFKLFAESSHRYGLLKGL
jgi:hypothetical protein